MGGGRTQLVDVAGSGLVSGNPLLRLVSLLGNCGRLLG